MNATAEGIKAEGAVAGSLHSGIMSIAIINLFCMMCASGNRRQHLPFNLLAHDERSGHTIGFNAVAVLLCGGIAVGHDSDRGEVAEETLRCHDRVVIAQHWIRHRHTYTHEQKTDMVSRECQEKTEEVLRWDDCTLAQPPTVIAA